MFLDDLARDGMFLYACVRLPTHFETVFSGSFRRQKRQTMLTIPGVVGMVAYALHIGRP